MLVWIAGGATCYRRPQMTEFNRPPAIFSDTPTVDELIAAVNRTDNVQKMQSTSTTIEMLDSSLPISRLSANLALERPRRLRLRAGISFALGSGLDVGSNDELFWMRYPDGMQHTLLYARHEEFQHHMIGSPLPVDPTWIIEALGLVHVDPANVQGEVIARGDGKLELRTLVPTASGAFSRILLIDAQGGFVRDQYLYSPDGRLVASANGAEHRFYPDASIVLPHSIRVQLQPVSAPPIGLQIEIGSYVVNQLLGSDPNMFNVPADSNGHEIDLSRMSGTLPPAEMRPMSPSSDGSIPLGANNSGQSRAEISGGMPTGSYVPTASYVPPYRGTQLR